MPTTPRRSKPSKEGRKRVSAKIAHLMDSEGKTQKQAVGQALNMEREGRLGPRGGYKPVKKRKQRGVKGAVYK